MASMQSLLEKMKNADPDIRYMSLQDLTSEASKASFHLDGPTEERVVDQVLVLMNDGNTEVKNHAVKAIGAIVKKVNQPRLLMIIDQLIQYTSSKDEQLRDIANLGLRTVIREIQPDSALGVTVCGKLAPKLVSQLASKGTSEDTQLGGTELLSDLFSRFERTITTLPDVQTGALAALLPLLSSPRAAVRKRAVDALGYLCACSTDAVSTTLIKQTILPALNDSAGAEKLKTGVSLVSAVVSRAPRLAGRRLAELVPKVLAAAQSDAAEGDDELREAALQALERVLLKCPREATTFVKDATDLASTLIKYDPNYAGGDDDDEGADAEMEDAEEDDYDDEAYSDDDDVSWKVRRAATKVLAAAIETRPDLLVAFYQTVSPVLISRFSEREETVRLEVWQTYTKLLDLTRIYGDSTSVLAPGAGVAAASTSTLKRKRGGSVGASASAAVVNGGAAPMDVDEVTPVALLRSETPLIARNITKQLATKSVVVRQAGFALLHSLVDVLLGGLDDYLGALVPRIEAGLSVTDTGVSGTGTALKLEVLAFMTALFESHSIAVLQPSLGRLVPQLVKAAADKFNKVAADALVTSAALVRVMRPLPRAADVAIMGAGAVAPLPGQLGGEIGKIYEVVVARLSASTTDQEVREGAIACLGDLLVHVGDALQQNFARSLELLRESMRREVTRVAAVRTAGRVAQSPVCAGHSALQPWALETLAEVAPLLRQSNRVVRAEAFACLPPLLHVVGSSLTPDAGQIVLAAVQPFLAGEDLQAVPLALNVLRALLVVQPALATSAGFQSDILPAMFALARLPGVQGVVLEGLIQLFVALVRAGAEPVPILDALSGPAMASDAGQAKGKGTGPAQKTSHATASRCIGAIVREKPELADQVANGLVGQLGNPKSAPAATAFSLLTLGEIGRFADFAQRAKAFQKAVALFSAPSDDIRSAAAFAAGNMAVGNADASLPELVAKVGATEDERSRSLALQALKEFITHTPATALAPRAEALWEPLFAICAVTGLQPVEPGLGADATDADKKARDKRVEAQWKENEPVREHWKATEAARNIAADCLGKIALTNPVMYLPLLQARLADPTSGIRAAVISAVRFTFTDESAAYDAALAPQIVSFLAPMKDTDLDVRRLALATLNSAAHHKPHLIRPHLPALLPTLYEETVINPALIRVVQMGPFVHRVDDGLDVRKAAYEAAYTLLDTCTSSIQMDDLLARVSAGISDDGEIRAISNLMLVKLGQVAPTTVTQSMDSLVEPFDRTLKEKLKDGTVKQEVEKMETMQKSALRAFVSLHKLASQSATPKYLKFYSELSTGPWAKDVAEVSTEAAKRNGDAMDID